MQTDIRQQWCERLWKRKGYDSPAEFMEPGNCFACGLRDGDELQSRSFTDGDEVSTHLLCGRCSESAASLKGERYLAWFWKRIATDTIADTMKRKAASFVAGLE